jgi:hypothetical protein
MQNLVEHSRSKDQFLRVAIKRHTKTQTFEDELKEVSELNELLLDLNQELEAQLAEDIQAKNSSHSFNPLCWLNHAQTKFWTVIVLSLQHSWNSYLL